MTAVSVNETKTQKKLKPRFVDNIAKKMVFKLLENIAVGHLIVEDNGVTYNFGQPKDQTDLVAHIHVEHPSIYRDVLFNGTVGSGEGYMLGSWRSPDLVKVIRLMVLNMSMLKAMDSKWNWIKQSLARLMHAFNHNSRTGSRKNIAAHYDLGNDFFQLFLDHSMMYSAAIFPSAAASLEEASENKLKHICERLQLGPTDHLLEIGTGWGGMAIYAAKHYGCRVTTTTISREQHDHALAWVRQEGLEERVTVLLKDYRELTGVYDKLVSIEMIEAVGHQYYQTYFRRCAALLKQDGLMLIQSITIPDQRYEQSRNTVDFIQRYIFPGGALPSIEVIARHVSSDTDMQIVGLEDITHHYAKTLAEWKQRFQLRLDEVRQCGFDDIFIRMWDFYLSYCEGGFAERVIGTSQFLFAKPRCHQLPVSTHLGVRG
ncbi:class I SAM-dependent methyltransferase [Exilibacterium tricleocarpae]|uniref:Class I SAM-dependent methyltransferase n=1 Tax=Exilibacterium tricleocarpae TaxID=2591008 RepID=A0A545TS75_9GAMM|nr:cyclopropane-fatty-acyl-phospholipid synthase family protein [Exilibacterium tricleocarpae]TQV80074.1 class I SAM-dependent methyltransferase [Exilibacterium tricleocarpae]